MFQVFAMMRYGDPARALAAVNKVIVAATHPAHDKPATFQRRITWRGVSVGSRLIQS